MTINGMKKRRHLQHFGIKTCLETVKALALDIGVLMPCHMIVLVQVINYFGLCGLQYMNDETMY